MKFLLLIILINASFVLNGQVDQYDIGDDVFRYVAHLEQRPEKFKDITFTQFDFPCVDRFKVVASNLPRTDFELETKVNFKEFYSYKDGVLNTIGYTGHDPFLNIPSSFIQYFKSIPTARSKSKESFIDQGQTDFFVVYDVNQLPQDLKSWCLKEKVEEITIMATVEWNNAYLRNDSFDDLLNVHVGYVIENNRYYAVSSIELKKDKREEVRLSDYPILLKYFKDQNYQYESFFPFNSVVEKARIERYPGKSIFFQSEEAIGNYSDCAHKLTEIYVFPNPTFNDINIQFINVPSGQLELTLYNIVGRKIWSQSFNVTEEIYQIYLDLPTLEKGVYLYTITDSNGDKLQSRRLVIMEH